MTNLSTHHLFVFCKQLLILVIVFFLSYKQSYALEFSQILIENQFSGDIKIVADFNNDGYKDIAMGGYPFNWYAYPNWNKTFIAQAQSEFTTDGEAGDVDGDGDMDIVVPDGSYGGPVLWFENKNNGASWTKHTIGTIESTGKDIELADFDKNGLLDVASRTHTVGYIYYQTSANSWTKTKIADLEYGEGMGSGDFDKDGDIDLLVKGAFLVNPGGKTNGSNWQSSPIASLPYNDFKAWTDDVNKDGNLDVLYSCSECGGASEVLLFLRNGSGWNKVSLTSLSHVHTLQTGDMDRDGDVDIVIGQMGQSSTKELAVLLNNGNSTSFTKQVIGNPSSGIHNGIVADIGSDGDLDIVGAQWIGNPPLFYYENNSTPSTLTLDKWNYQQATNQHHQTFGLTSADVNNDGKGDIISGKYWYANPGSQTQSWTRSNELPNFVHAFETMDVDGDSNADIFGQVSQNGAIALYWLEAVQGGSSWQSTLIGSVPSASHYIGFQGYHTADLIPGNKEELIVSSGGGIYYFTVPTNPTNGNWPRILVSNSAFDEGFGVGDIDKDGYLDIAAGTGDSKRVEWYRNPQNGNANWQITILGSMADATFPDRFAIADLNGDGRVDVIGTEENGNSSGAETYWWEQPTNAFATNWPRKTLTSQGSTHSLDVADLDKDGDTDIVLGEHRGTNTTTVWKNNGGGNFTRIQVDSGKESHLGTRLFDLDRDGDMDIVSIAYDNNSLIHVWWNQAINGNVTIPTPTPVVTPTPPIPVKCMGDFNSDGVINISDFSVLLSEFGKTQANQGLRADANGDGIVNIADFSLLISVFGNDCQQQTSLNPIIYFNFDQNNQTSFSSQLGNVTATFNNMSWTTGVSGYGLNLTGSNYLTLNNLNLPTNQLTVHLNAKFPTAPTNDARIFSKASGTGEQDHDLMISTTNDNGTRLRFRLKVNGLTKTLIADQTTPLNSWVKIDATFDGNQMKLYQNGQLVASTTHPGQATFQANTATWIGSNPPDNSQPMTGQVDSLKIFDRALNSSEIQQLVD